MKKFLLAAYIFFCTGGTYAQSRPNTVVAEIDFNRPLDLSKYGLSVTEKRHMDTTYAPRPDTIRATLLITRDRMRMAHSYDGYMVIRGRDTVYLDDRKRLIKPPVKVWGFKRIN